MAKMKSLTAKEVENIISSLQQNLDGVEKCMADMGIGKYPYAYGYLTTGIKNIIKQLKREYPIT